ncbi:MAG: hypothetical protein WCF68_12415 [Terriglobales bacterium]
MLRAEFDWLDDGPTLRLEGRFVGEWAEQAKSLVTRGAVPAGLVIDLTEMAYADAVGEQVLIWFGSIGARFVAATSYAMDVCERLHLPLREDPGNSSGGRHRGAVRGPSPGRARAG